MSLAGDQLIAPARPSDWPAAGLWRLDPGHAEVGFRGKHFMLTTVRGRFTGVEATVRIGERPEETTVEAVIDMGSVETGFGPRDEHLRSADFFDVTRWPQATFRSTSVVWQDRRGSLAGNLTLRDVTRPVVLVVEYHGRVRDPWGDERAVFSATGRINREDWKLDWNMPLDGGRLLVSKEIDLELDLELVGEG